jgi:uncharacterized protein
MKDKLLLIFVRNPVWGKVKTRLAATLGPEKALAIYVELLNQTKAITQNLNCTKIVYYADYLNQNDIWSNALYQKKMQQGQDLGERMLQAFTAGFEAGYARICIIGSDCYELTPEIIKEGFAGLATHDLVVGPVSDGGYYLLGLNKLHPDLFQNINWSTAIVLEQTLEIARQKQLTATLLPVLTDIDEEKDLSTMPDFINY